MAEPVDMLDKYATAIAAGEAVAPPDEADMLEKYAARLRPEVVTQRLEGKGAPATTHAAPIPHLPQWNAGYSTINGMLQGYLPPLLSYATGAKPEDIKKSRELFSKEHSGANLTGELLGSASTSLPLMALGQQYVAAPLGARLAAAAPRAGTAISDFLAGSSKGAAALPSWAARGAIEGGTAGAISSGLNDAPVSEQIMKGAMLGSVFNPAFRVLANPSLSHISPTAAESAQALIDQGIPVRFGQIPGASKVSSVMDKIFSSKGNQGEAWNEALSGHAGMPTREINQEWIGKNDRRIGTTMNNIQSVYSIPQLESGLLSDLSALRAHANSNLSNDNAKKVGDFIQKIEEHTFDDINGSVYKNLTQKGGLIDNMSKDVDIKPYAMRLRDALDEAWGRSLPADKKAAWDQARREYKITRTIDDSMGAVGASEGKYNPRKLLSAVEQRFGNVENAEDLGLLARGGQFLPPEAVPKHGFGSAIKHAGSAAVGAAAATTAMEGSHAISHFGPELIANIAQHPESYTIPALLAGLGYGVGKTSNWMLNSPRATQYGLDLATGARQPVMRGVNPVLPFLVEGANR